jgi:hypothetical protein
VPVVSVDVGDVAERIAGIEGCHLVGIEPEEIALGLHNVWRRKQRVDGRGAIQTLSIGAVAKRLKVFYNELLQPQASGRSARFHGKESV